MKKITDKNHKLRNENYCCSSKNVISNKKHWEKIYKKSDETKLGWYQKSANQSISLIKQTKINKNEPIADIGSGSSILIDNLLNNGFSNLIATDISKSALEITKKRINKQNLDKVKFIIDDLTRSTKLSKLQNISIWHDRAFFHFLTNKKDQKNYFMLLNNLVKKGKFVIIATFNLKSATKCSGFPIKKHDENKIAEFLGKNYTLINHFNYNHVMPSGSIRPYIYTLFKKETDKNTK